MIALDTNLLVYAHRQDSPFHTGAARAVREAAEGRARVASLCLAHGIEELWSADRDFSRFPTLRTRNPTAEDPGH